jgi:hypothetical protein
LTSIWPDVPEVVVERLPQYLRALSHLEESGLEVISSQQLGELLQVTPAQIRKDLSYFGRFGKQGRGYSIPHLLAQLRQILGLDQTWNVAVVGVGTYEHSRARGYLAVLTQLGDRYDLCALCDSGAEALRAVTCDPATLHPRIRPGRRRAGAPAARETRRSR